MKITFTVQGKHLFVQPPPNVVYAIELKELEAELEDLMQRYHFDSLRVEKVGS